MKKHWIFVLAVSAVFVFQNCKEKHETASGTSNEQPQELAVEDDDDHKYLFYIGEAQENPSINQVYGQCNFTSNGNASNKLFLRNTETAATIGQSNQHYYYLTFTQTNRTDIDRTGTYLLLKNEAIDDNTDDPNYHPTESETGKGSLGCFPRFIMKNGHLDYFENAGRKYIQLPFAYHEQDKHVIETLKCMDFCLSNSDYEILDSMLQTEPHLHGGIERETQHILRVYLPNDTLWQNFTLFR